MALSDQIANYADCEDLYTKAKADPIGARALFTTRAQANYFRLRMNHYRILLRREAARLYDKTHPLHGKSDYDEFLCQIKQGEDDCIWVYITRYNTEIIDIEPLSEVESPTDGLEA